MRSITALIFALLCVTAVRTVTADDPQCMCTCCSGDGCTPFDEPGFSLTNCTDAMCLENCKTRYPTDCAGENPNLVAMCMSASHIYNRYTTIGAFILVFSVIAMFRI